MNKIAVIHQPDFLPHIGFFHKLLVADIWVVLDSVQFLAGSKSWHNRDRIKAKQGVSWLTVPVKKSKQKTNINEVLLAADLDWRTKHLNVLHEAYRQAKFFDEIMPHLEKLYRLQTGDLLSFNLASINMLLDLFEINITQKIASDLSVLGKANDLLVSILQEIGISQYLAGEGARDYFDPMPYQQANIEVLWQDYQHPVYPQLHGEFVPYLSSIDVLFNCGIERSREILRSC